jgi:hypothetical protein
VYLSPDDARSDVILAAAATVLGGFAVAFLTRLPLYPQRGLLAMLLGVVWILALTAVVPLLLSRYRGDRAAAFGLDGPRGAWVGGLVLAVPVALVGIVLELFRSGQVTDVLLGRIGTAARLATLFDAAATTTVVAGLRFAALTVGTLALVGFLAVRGREAFRPTDVSLTQLVRTLGMGAAGAALVLGLLRSLGPGRPVPVLVNAVGLAVLVLLADRLVPAGRDVPRAAIVTPVVVVVVAHVFAAGGLFRGDLPLALYTGALAAGTATVIAALALTRDRAWAILPLAVALHWWPTCLSPLALELGAALC